MIVSICLATTVDINRYRTATSRKFRQLFFSFPKMLGHHTSPILWFINLNMSLIIKILENRINPFHANDLFWYPLKTLENQRFSDIFRRYQKGSVAILGNGFTQFCSWLIISSNFWMQCSGLLKFLLLTLNGVLMVNFQHISHLFLVFLLLTLNKC